MFGKIKLHLELIIALTKRDISEKYKGSALGVIWALITPILMMIVYTFVFSVVFRARWNGGGESKVEYALILFAGLSIFYFFSECITRSTNLVVANTNYVKKVVFPLEILPLVTILTAIFHLIINIIVWLIFYLIFVGMPHLATLTLPFVLLHLYIFVLGLSFFLASLGVYIRDIGQIIGFIITSLMFLSPIFYPLEMLPINYQNIMYLNPLTSVISTSRNILMLGILPSFVIWLAQLVVSLLIFKAGLYWFQKTRCGFADVL